jgi:DNA end-binding protein Ku
MAPRANWKGHLQLAALSCPVALYTAVSASERVVFNTVNRDTGHRVRREFIDSGTAEAVAKEDQVKGYATGKDQYIILEADELASAAVKSDKILAVSAFIGADDMDEAFFDKPYYLAPAEKAGVEVFALICEGLRRRKAMALAHAVLFRRLRTIALRPQGDGLIATTLHFDYEVRPAKDVFDEVGKLEIKGEMLDLAKHIINTKKGSFDPAQFQDHYEAAVAELVKAKIEGRTISPPKQDRPRGKIDVMQALRESAGAPAPSTRRKPAARPAEASPKPKTAQEPKTAKGRRKAG